jgi:protein-disulfide isomerase
MTPPDGSARLTLPVGPRDHVQGSDDAPVTLLEYGDYQCPYCGEAYPIVHEVQRRLGPRLRFVFRNFPIGTSHPFAPMAAESAEAAGAQGKFWEMHDMLYEHQDALAETHLVGYARVVGVNVDRFRSELEGHTYQARVQEDFMSGVRSGVNGTPTFYINGVRHDGSYDLPELLGAIEEHLSDGTRKGGDSRRHDAKRTPLKR